MEKIIDKIGNDARMEKIINKVGYDVRVVCATILGTLIYTFGILWFIDSNMLYSSGLIGVSQLIVNLAAKYDLNIPMNIGLINLIFNIPLIFLAFKKLNKRFAIYSLVSLTIQTVILMLSPFGIGDVETYSWITDKTFLGLGPDGSIVNAGNVLSSALVGGLLIGAGTGISMKFGSSTAGLDIYAQYYSLSRDKSVGGFFLLFNGVIIAIAFIALSPVLAIYSLVRQIIATTTLDKVHTSYNFVKLEIISNEAEEIAQLLLKETGRGITKTHVLGAYSNQEIVKLVIACTSYELPDILKIVYNIDNNAFTTTHNIHRINGRFKKRLIGTKK